MQERARAIGLVRAHPTPTVVIATVTSWDAFPSLWPKLLEEVWGFVRLAELDAGRNVMVYRGDDAPEVEVGVEVGADFAGNGRVVPSSLPAGFAAKTIEYGPPARQRLGDAHAAVRAWCAANGHALEGTRWEIYDHWRADRDPAAFETEIYWLIGESP